MAPRCPAQGPARRLLLRLRLLPVPAPMPLGGFRAAVVADGPGGLRGSGWAGLGQPQLPRPAAVYGGRPGCLSARRPAPPRPAPAAMARGRTGKRGRAGAAGSPPGGGRDREELSVFGFPLPPRPGPQKASPPGAERSRSGGEAGGRRGKPHLEPRGGRGGPRLPRPPAEVLRALPQGSAARPGLRQGSKALRRLHELPYNFIFYFTCAISLTTAYSHLDGVASY